MDRNIGNKFYKLTALYITIKGFEFIHVLGICIHNDIESLKLLTFKKRNVSKILYVIIGNFSHKSYLNKIFNIC